MLFSAAPFWRETNAVFVYTLFDFACQEIQRSDTPKGASRPFNLSPADPSASDGKAQSKHMRQPTGPIPAAKTRYDGMPSG